MKTMARAIGLLCVLHVLALLGGVGWLAATGRLSEERINKTAELFRPTVAEAKKQREAEKVQEDAEQHAERAERAAGADTGTDGDASAPQTAAEALADQRQRNELTLRRIERARAEVQRLRDQLQAGQQRLEQQQEDLAEKRKAFDQRLKQVEQKKNEEGFQRAVRLYESLPEDQVKNMFMSMIDEGNTEQVVAYLEAMQTRTAGKVLEAFQTPEEITQAVELTERLRQRGSDLTDNAEDVG